MRKLIIGAAAAVFLLGLSACSGAAGGGTAKAGGTLSLATIVPATSFVPGAMAADGPATFYDQAVYDTVLTLDAKGQPAANLATKWSYDKSLTTLSLTLRSGVTFTDGTAFNAKALKANLEFAQKGAGDAASALRSLDHVDAVDATHANIVLKAPDPSLLGNLARGSGYMASPKALSNSDLATNPVGSGPYTLDQSKTTAGDVYFFTRNKNYWNKAAYPYDQVKIKDIEDANAALNGLRSGQIQGYTTTAKYIKGAKAAGLNVVTYNNGGLEGLFLWDREGKNTPALADIRVRQAINYAIDRSSIVKNVNSGLGSATVGIIPPQAPGYDKSIENAYPFDLAKAKKLMAAAGYADGFSMTLPDFSPVFPDAQAAMTEALTSLKIKVTYAPITGDQVVGSIIGGQWPMNYFTLSGNAWDLAQLTLTPQSPFNPFHVVDPKMAKLLDTIQSTTGDAQSAAYGALNKYVVEQAWFAPWDFAQVPYLSTKNVKVTVVPGVGEPPLSGFAPAK